MTLEIKVVEDLAKLSLVIWSNSELAHEEFKADDTVTEFLDNYKFPCTGGQKFYPPYTFQSIGWRQSQRTTCGAYIGHASGHNLIVDAGEAFAIATKACFKAAGKPFRKVSLLSTPAEDQRGGKLFFIKAQIFQDVDFAMTAHPLKYFIFRPNYVAISEVSVHFI